MANPIDWYLHSTTGRNRKGNLEAYFKRILLCSYVANIHRKTSSIENVSLWILSKKQKVYSDLITSKSTPPEGSKGFSMFYVLHQNKKYTFNISIKHNTKNYSVNVRYIAEKINCIQVAILCLNTHWYIQHNFHLLTSFNMQ